MRKTILLTIFVCISLIPFVSAEELSKEIPGWGDISGDYIEQQFEFSRGWNLVYGLANPNWLTEGDISPSDIKAIYGFNSGTREYIRLYPEPDLDKLNDASFRLDYLMGSTAFWVYIDYPANKRGVSEYWALTPFIDIIDELEIFSGWNFLGITNGMIGKTLNDIKGNCNIEKSFWFSSRDQAWLAWDDNVLSIGENVATGMALKVSNECTLKYSKDQFTPPPVPN